MSYYQFVEQVPKIARAATVAVRGVHTVAASRVGLVSRQTTQQLGRFSSVRVSSSLAAGHSRVCENSTNPFLFECNAPVQELKFVPVGGSLSRMPRAVRPSLFDIFPTLQSVPVSEPVQVPEPVQVTKKQPLDHVQMVMYTLKMKEATRAMVNMSLPVSSTEPGRNVRVVKYIYDPATKKLTVMQDSAKPGKKGLESSADYDHYTTYLEGLIAQLPLSTTQKTEIKLGHLRRETLLFGGKKRPEEDFHRDAVPRAADRHTPDMVVAYLDGECLPTYIRVGKEGQVMSLTSTADQAIFFPQQVEHNGETVKIFHRGQSPAAGQHRMVLGISFEKLSE